LVSQLPHSGDANEATSIQNSCIVAKKSIATSRVNKLNYALRCILPKGGSEHRLSIKVQNKQDIGTFRFI